MKRSLHEEYYGQRRKLIGHLLGLLRRRSVHPGQIKLLETHISWVILDGKYAYKIKKPVDLGFLDFTSLQSRRHFCEEEVRLNQRLAPGLYIGLVAIGGSLQHPEIASAAVPESGPALEYAVKLVRFPESRQLDLMAKNHQLQPQHIDNLAILLAKFHRSLAGAPLQQEWGGANKLLAATEQNFIQLQELLVGSRDMEMLLTLHKKSLETLRRCTFLLDERKRLGFVRECHGDLHLGNIVLLDDHPVPFDAIEFSAAFRWIDVLDEVAFTMMDLLYHGLCRLAWRFLNGYLEITGDYEGLPLLQMYLSFRATVRAKVSAIHAVQPDVHAAESGRAWQDCRAHLQLAEACLASGKPALIITHGLPGSGKSTFSQMAAECLGAVRLRSDVERKRLFGLDALEQSREATGSDLYTADISRKTYDRLMHLAGILLEAGFIVIVDAAFLKLEMRASFQRLASEKHARFIIASVTADPVLLRERLRKRQMGHGDASEADIHVLEKLQQTADSLSVAEQRMCVVFENGARGLAGCNDSWLDLRKRVSAATV